MKNNTTIVKATLNTLNTNTLASVQLSQVIEQLKQDDSTLLQAYSEYAADNNYDSVFNNDYESINIMCTDSYDAIRSAFYGDYNPSHAYFTFNGYGNLQSFEYLDSDNCPIDVEELAQWIVDNELFNDYDIEVTTLDDMYNCILDNLEDASSLDDIIDVNDLLGLSLNEFDNNNESPADYEVDLINTIMLYIEDDYDLLTKVVEYLKLDV